MERLGTFKNELVSFIKTQAIKDGVVCDIYTFTQDSSKDLGIVTVSPGFKTPPQRVLLGDATIEGYMSGEGTLTVTKKDGKVQKYYFSNPTEAKEVEIKVDEIMQWENDGNSDLVFYEICLPPYKDGRYENL